MGGIGSKYAGTNHTATQRSEEKAGETHQHSNSPLAHCELGGREQRNSWAAESQRKTHDAESQDPEKSCDSEKDLHSFGLVLGESISVANLPASQRLMEGCLLWEGCHTATKQN